MVTLALPVPRGPALPKEVSRHLRRGEEALSAGDSQKALEEYRLARLDEQSLGDPMANTHILWAIAAALHGAGKPDEALTYIVQAMEVAPQDAQLRSAHGVILATLERFREAAIAFDLSLGLEKSTFVEEARRQVLNAQLRRLSKRGVLSWSGSKPEFPKEKLEWVGDGSLSDWVIESRR